MQKVFLTLVLSLILFSCNRHEEDVKKQINAHLQLGIEKELTQPAESIDLYLKALDMSEKIGHAESLRQCYTNLAIVYQGADLFQEAESHYLSALDAARKISLAKEANTLRNLGQLCKTWGNYKKAEQYYTQALEVSGDKTLKSILGNDLGILAENKHEYKKALSHYINAHTGDGIDLLNVGRMQVKLGQPEVGLQNIENGISILKKGIDTPNLSAALIARVEALAALKRTAEAKAALVEAETVANQLTGMQRKNLLEVYSLAQDLGGQSGYFVYKQKAEKIQDELEILRQSGRAARFKDQALIRKAEADRAALFYREEKTHKRLIAFFAATTLIALAALAFQYWRIYIRHKEDSKLMAAINPKRIKKDNLFDI